MRIRLPWSLGPTTGVRFVLGWLPGILACFAFAGILVPLPAPLVDILLSLSLALAMALFVIALRVRKSNDVLAFPSLLLGLTLFRLSLNISTTRLILSDGYAGQVIASVGDVVVRGELIVGIVMFALITVVQFFVIAKGAERAAEVGARFALDAMPGEQAAIEADLRSSRISARDAARRRFELAERSDFLGRMDGAMRFVRGDAVVGLAITAINLCAGIWMGVSRFQLSLGDAFEQFGRLTVGDGLLSQIPALMISLASGILVSKVDPRHERRRRWPLGGPVLVLPGLCLVGLAMLPGMPKLAFTVVGLAILGLGLFQGRLQAMPGGRRRAVLRWELKVREGGKVSVQELEVRLPALRRRLSGEFGFSAPEIQIVEAKLGFGEVELHRPGAFVASCKLENIDGLGPERSRDRILAWMYAEIRGHASELIDLARVDRWVDRIRRREPELVQMALRAGDLRELLQVLRGFLREGLRLPPLRELLQVMAESECFDKKQSGTTAFEQLRRRTAGHWLLPIWEGLCAKQNPPQGALLTPDFAYAIVEAFVPDEEGGRFDVPMHQLELWADALVRAADGRVTYLEVLSSQRAAVACLTRVSRASRGALALPVFTREDLQILGAFDPGRPRRMVDESFELSPPTHAGAS